MGLKQEHTIEHAKRLQIRLKDLEETQEQLDDTKTVLAETEAQLSKAERILNEERNERYKLENQWEMEKKQLLEDLKKHSDQAKTLTNALTSETNLQQIEEEELGREKQRLMNMLEEERIKREKAEKALLDQRKQFQRKTKQIKKIKKIR